MSEHIETRLKQAQLHHASDVKTDAIYHPADYGYHTLLATWMKAYADDVAAERERVRQMEEALTGLAEAVRMYRQTRLKASGAVTMTGSEAAMYQAMHHSHGVLGDSTHPEEVGG